MDTNHNAHRTRTFRRPRLGRVVGCLLALFVLVACGESTPPELTLRVLYSLDGLGDRAFADSSYRGIVRAEQQLALTRIEQTPDDLAHAERIYNDWLGEAPAAPELLLSIGQLYTGFIAEAACPPEGRYYLHLDDELPPCPTRISLDYRTFAPSFLAGVAAITLAPNKRAAVLGGMDLPTVNEFMDGFAAGVAYAGGELVERAYLAEDVSGFSDSANAYDLAQDWYDRVDVIFPVAGASGAGVIEAAKTAAGRYVIGVDADQSYLGRGVVIGSVVKQLDQSVERLLLDAAYGAFVPGHQRVGLSDGATAFVVNPLFAARIAQALEAATPAALEAEGQFEAARGGEK